MKRCAVLLLALLVILPVCPASAEDRPVTRGDFVSMLWCASGSPPAEQSAPFLDVSAAGVDAISWAYAQGFTRGIGGSVFCPNRAITREETAVLLRRYAAGTGRDVFLPDGLATCNDNEGISPWADDALYWATDRAILDWSPGGQRDPYGHITPAAAAASIQRLLKKQRISPPPVAGERFFVF